MNLYHFVFKWKAMWNIYIWKPKKRIMNSWNLILSTCKTTENIFKILYNKMLWINVPEHPTLLLLGNTCWNVVRYIAVASTELFTLASYSCFTNQEKSPFHENTGKQRFDFRYLSIIAGGHILTLVSGQNVLYTNPLQYFLKPCHVFFWATWKPSKHSRNYYYSWFTAKYWILKHYQRWN